jgi:hypothetical protein
MTAVQTGLIWTYGSVGPGLLLANEAVGMPVSNWAEHALTAVGVASAMGRCAAVGLYGSSLRQELLESKKSYSEPINAFQDSLISMI